MMAKRDPLKEVEKEFTQKGGLSIEELELLSDFKHSDFWPKIKRLLKNNMHQAIIACSHIRPENSGVDVKLARYRGMIDAIRDIINKIDSVDGEYNEMINKKG